MNSKDTSSGVSIFIVLRAGWNLWSPVCMLNIRNVLSNFQGLRQGHAFNQHVIRIGYTHIVIAVAACFATEKLTPFVICVL